MARTIAETNGLFSKAFREAPSINDLGSVVFDASLKSGGRGIFLGNGGPPVTIADTTGPFRDFVNAVINNSGEVAFFASLTAGGYGIFTGADVIRDKVIESGDLLFGSTILGFDAGAGIARVAINDNGQIAFVAALADGSMGVFRADPIPTCSDRHEGSDDEGDDDCEGHHVPEPLTAFLVTTGFVGLAVAWRRRHQ